MTWLVIHLFISAYRVIALYTVDLHSPLLVSAAQQSPGRCIARLESHGVTGTEGVWGPGPQNVQNFAWWVWTRTSQGWAQGGGWKLKWKRLVCHGSQAPAWGGGPGARRLRFRMERHCSGPGPVIPLSATLLAAGLLLALKTRGSRASLSYGGLAHVVFSEWVNE